MRNVYATESPNYRSGVKVGQVASLLAGGLASTTAGRAGLAESTVVSSTGLGVVIGGPGAVVSGAVAAKGLAEVAVGTLIGSNTIRTAVPGIDMPNR